MGPVGLVRQQVSGTDECEVSYPNYKPYWRRGFAMEGTLACRDYAFETLNRRRVTSLVREEDAASQASREISA